MHNDYGKDMSLEIINLTVIYNEGMEDETQALKGVNASFCAGEITAVVGEMGSGKSTLADHLNGLLTPTEGLVLLDGQDVSRTENKKEIARRVGYIMQQPEKQIFCQTVKEEIAFAPKNFGFTQEETECVVKEVAKELGLSEELLQKDPLKLSSGQKRMVAIASVLAQKPDYLVLDEPTVGLDDFATRDVLKLLIRLKEKNIGVIFITHNFDYAFAIADKFLVLKEGEAVLLKTKEEAKSFSHYEENFLKNFC